MNTINDLMMNTMCYGCDEPIVYEGPGGLPWGTVDGEGVCSPRCCLRVMLLIYQGKRTIDGVLRISSLRQMVEQGHDVGEISLLIETNDEPEWVVGEPVAIDGGVVLEGCFVDRDGREWDEVRRDWPSIYDVAATAPNVEQIAAPKDELIRGCAVGLPCCQCYPCTNMVHPDEERPR